MLSIRPRIVEQLFGVTKYFGAAVFLGEDYWRIIRWQFRKSIFAIALLGHLICAIHELFGAESNLDRLDIFNSQVLLLL